jgi:hypothetical protein
MNQISALSRGLDSNLVAYSETLDDMLTQSPQFRNFAPICKVCVDAWRGGFAARVRGDLRVGYAVVRRTREVGIRMALLFCVGAFDAVSFIGVTTLFFLIAMLAAYVPARRAVRVDPMVALRYE